jgi:serine/threonine-protein kinase SRPK3
VLLTSILDFHLRNIAFEIPDVNSLSDKQFIKALGKPEVGRVRRADGSKLGVHAPPYLVRPTTFWETGISRNLTTSNAIRIIDFGESFFLDRPPSKIHTALPVRAPEVFFLDKNIDYRVDSWSMGCLVLSLPYGMPRPQNFIFTNTGLHRFLSYSLASHFLMPSWLLTPH